MIGNTQGWVTSAIIALLGGWLLWEGSRPPRVTEPSGRFPKLLAKIELPKDPKTVAPVEMKHDCDAGEKYRAAIEDYLGNRRQYEKWHQNAKLALADKPKGVELVADAAGCVRAVVFARTPREVLNYDSDPPPMEAVEQLGGMAVQRGILHLRAKEPELSRRYLAGAFSLGYHLHRERVTWREFNTGVNLMTDASRYLAQLETEAGNADKAAAIQAFAAEADTYKLELFNIHAAINSLDPGTISRHGGDVLLLARSSPEPMWRGAAILALGRMKYNTPSRGDQLAAQRVVKDWLADADPVARTAANAANGLTIEQYRTLK